MNTTAQAFFKKRFKSQLTNLITSGTVLTLLALGLMGGAVSGVSLARWASDSLHASDSIKALIVILMTVNGFISSLFFSYALSAHLVRLSFSAKASLHPKAVWAFQQVIQNQNRIQIDLFEIDDSQHPQFGANVVVAGFTLGRSFFRPAIFASKTVIAKCTHEELQAIFAHEMAHLSEWHLFARLKKALATFFLATFFMSFVLLGLQWSGYTQVVTLASTFAGVVPAILTWLQTRHQISEQEKEADQVAIEKLGAPASGLLSALKKLSALNSGQLAPIVAERIAILEKLQPTQSPAQAA